MLYAFVRILMYLLSGMAVIAFLAGQKDGRWMAITLALLPVCLYLYWLQKRLWRRQVEKKPISCVEATLVNHRQQFSGRGMRYEKSFLTVQLEGGREIEFEVSRDEFDRIQIGARGTLAYREGQSVSFRKPV